MTGELRMLDDIYAANLPYGADAYAGYTDGAWSDWLAEVAKFPNVHILSIAVFASDDADCLDVENGDATIGEVYGWFTRQQARGLWRPCIYTGAANLRGLLATMSANGFSRSSWRCWSAHYGAGKHICGPGTCGYPQADATQWRDNAPGLNGSWIDESLLPADFFGAPPPPPPPVATLPAAARSGDEMFYLPNGAGATISVPVPAAVLKATGIIGPPDVIRFGTNAAAEVATNTDKAGWVPFPIDGTRSPNVVALPAGAQEVEIQRVDAGKNFVTADFA